jgi:hypothetical protein
VSPDGTLGARRSSSKANGGAKPSSSPHGPYSGRGGLGGGSDVVDDGADGGDSDVVDDGADETESVALAEAAVAVVPSAGDEPARDRHAVSDAMIPVARTRLHKRIEPGP